MNRLRTFVSLGLIASAFAATTGCHATLWTQRVRETLPLGVEGLEALQVRTHNGAIKFRPLSDGDTNGTVAVSKKTGGFTLASAAAAMDALDVYVEPGDDGTTRIGWRWDTVKRPGWAAKVSFKIEAPRNIGFNARTHNGPIEATGIVGDVRLRTHNGRIIAGSSVEEVRFQEQAHGGATGTAEITGNVRLVTHNGRINVHSTGGTLYARTHNGRIIASYGGDSVQLTTHNGRVSADLAACKTVEGTIHSHNGAIELVLGESTSAELRGRTHNGGIHCEVPISNVHITRRSITGTIGEGGGTLNLTTHNGSIRIKKPGG